MSTVKHELEESGKWRQLLAAGLINLMTLTTGLLFSWTSPVIAHLKSPETSVGDKPLNDTEISWLTSALALGAMAFLPFCSKISEAYGRKRTAQFAAIPLLLSWLLKVFARSYGYLLVARFFGGMAAALSIVIVPIYVSEIANASIRGLLGSLLLFNFRVGLVLGFSIGAALSFRNFAICGILVPVIFTITFCFMPETPIYLVRQGRINEARRSLMFFKANNQLIVENELQRLQALTKESLDAGNSIGLRDLFRDRGTMMGFIIAVGLVTGQELSGISPVISYTSQVFEDAGSSMSSHSATILVGSLQLLGSWISTMAIEKMGRRKLILISCFGMATCHATFGIFSLIKHLGGDISCFSWIPVISLSSFGFVYCLGLGPIPYILISEIFSTDIVSFASSIVMEIAWLCSFVFTKFFPFMVSAIGLHGCFIFLACMCVYIFFFTWFLVPETRGRNIESILQELNEGKCRHKKNKDAEAAVEMITKSPNIT